MKNYVAVDSLNPNAVNPRYGRPATMIGVEEVAIKFSASSDEEAAEIFFKLIEDGKVGYSEMNTQRINPKLYRSKVWYKKNK